LRCAPDVGKDENRTERAVGTSDKDRRDKDAEQQPAERFASGLRPRGSEPLDLEANPGDEAKRVAHLIEEAAVWLSRVPSGPLRRDFELTLERYRRAAREWDERSSTQRSILLQCIHSLRSAIARST
jgi:hypothetical protein